MKSVHSVSGMPGSLQRKQILSFESTSRGLAGDVDFDFVAYQTFGLTHADLARAVECAASASENNGEERSINTSDLLEGVRKVALSPGRQGSILGPQDKKKMAFAAAARAVVAASLGRHEALEQVCIFPPESSPPETVGHYAPASSRRPSKIPQEMVVSAAGRAAEKLFFGKPAAPLPIKSGRMAETETETAGNLQIPSAQLSKAAEQCASDIVSTYRSHVEAIARRLEDEETLAGRPLQSMLEAVHREAELFGPPCFPLEATAT